MISFYFYGYTFFKLEHTIFKTVKKGFLLFWPDFTERGGTLKFAQTLFVDLSTCNVRLPNYLPCIFPPKIY